MAKRETGEPMRYGAGFCDPNAALPIAEADIKKELNTVKGNRLSDITNDKCPECGGELDTGWECNKCGFDAMPRLKASPFWNGD